MDLNELREQLRKSRPVEVTRTGRLVFPENAPGGGGPAIKAAEVPDAEPTPGRAGPSRLKEHTFAAGWHEADPARFDAERRAMAAHTRARLRFLEGKVAFEETVDTNFDLPFHMVVVCPERYPTLPPKVFCIDPEVPPETRYHLYADGSLCLFLSHEWTRDLTLLDVRNWACEWAFNVLPRVLLDHPWMSKEHA
ncbi:hypothetical protein L6V77_26960 [Myxococcota bacterium]|jgi:hypothetical protein|nr:hypothetical protein [Myxococcota bacterium]